jgi:O-antigen ligase
MMQSQGRLSTEGVEASAEYRVEYIWRPLLQYALGHPFLGIGPGSLGTSRYPWTEAHNIILRVALDFGLFTAACFAFLLGTLLVRSWRAGRGAQSVEQRVFATVAFYSVAVVVVAGMLQESLSAVMSSHLTMLTVGLFAGATACAHPD